MAHILDIKYKAQKARILEITPDIQPIFDELARIDGLKIDAAGKKQEEIDTSKLIEKGGETLVAYIHMILETHEERIFRVLSRITGISENNLMDDYDIIDIIKMAVETITNKRLLPFFPQFAPLAARLRSAISQK
jgi:hypothetical protein